VKEHFSQSAAALRGTLGRSPETYAMLETIPGVKMLGIKANTPELITRAECVFTLTGKVGIEAALKGTPVVFGGQPWWMQMPGSASLSRFKDKKELAKFLKSARPSRDEVFGWLTDQFSETLVPILGDATVERYSERISPLPARFSELQMAVVVSAIEQFVKSLGAGKA
jgi:capsule polysaccharide export protein KpsC/LpsZ